MKAPMMLHALPLLLFLVGCANTPAVGADAAHDDSGGGARDAGLDASLADAPPGDAARADATTLDALALDASALDATVLDATVLDATAPDAFALDAAVADANVDAAVLPGGSTLGRLVINGPGSQTAHAIATDSDGSLVVVGEFESAIDIGLGFTTALTAGNAFIARFAPDGTPVWLRTLSSCRPDAFNDVAIGADHAIWVGGYVSVSSMTPCRATFGGAPVGSAVDAAATAGIVARYGADGSEQALAFRGTSVEGVALTSTGTPLIVERANDYIPFLLTGSDVLSVWALDPVALTWGWQQVLHSRTGTRDDSGVFGGIAVAGDGAFVATTFSGSVMASGGPWTSVGGTDVILRELAVSDGHVSWSTRMGGTNDDRAFEVAPIPGGIAVFGQYQGLAYFGGTALTSTGTNYYVSRWSTAATYLGSFRTPGTGVAWTGCGGDALFVGSEPPMLQSLQADGTENWNVSFPLARFPVDVVQRPDRSLALVAQVRSGVTEDALVYLVAP